MKKTLAKIVLGICGGILALGIGCVIFIQNGWKGLLIAGIPLLLGSGIAWSVNTLMD